MKPQLDCAPLGTRERCLGDSQSPASSPRRLPPANSRSTAKRAGWLAPEQVRVITIGEEEPLLNYAKQIVNELRAQQVRATGDYGSDPMKAKIANAEQAKVHTMLVIGGCDMEAGAVSVRILAWQPSAKPKSGNRGEDFGGH